MLQKFRNNLKGAGATVIVLIIAVPFIFFGIDSLFLRSGSSQEVAKVGDEVITDLQLRQAMTIYKNQLRNRFSEIDPDQLDEDVIRKSVLDGLILERTIQLAAKDGAMAVPEDFIYSLLVDVPAYQTEGEFDINRYEYAIRQMGYNPTSHARAISAEVLGRVFMQGVLNSAMATPHQLEMLASLVTQQRDYYFLTIPGSSVAQNIQVTDQEINDFYTNNQALFLSPEMVQVEFVELRIDDLTDQVDVPEEDIRALYDSQLDQQTTSSQKEVAHILLDPEAAGYQEKLESLSSKLKAGGNFSDLAREFSEDPGSAENGGLLGFVTPGDLPEELDQALSEMQVGEVSEPISSEAGIHILFLKSEQQADIATYEEMRPALRDQLARQSASELYIERIEMMRESAYNADSLAETADLIEQPLQKSDFFGRHSGNGKIAGNPELVRVAFSEDVLLNGYPSEVLELADDHAIVMRVTEHRPESVQSLDMVKDQVHEVLLKQKKLQQLQSVASTIQDQVENGDSIENIAILKGYDWQVGKAVTRNDGRVDQEVRDFVFGMPANVATTQVDGFQKANGDFVVVAQTGVANGTSSSLTKEQLKALAGQLTQASAISDLDNYRQYLLSQVKVVR